MMPSSSLFHFKAGNTEGNGSSSSSSSSFQPSTTGAPTNRNTDVASLLLRLVQHQLRSTNTSTNDDVQRQAHIAKVFRLCVRLLNSRISAGNDESSLLTTENQMLLAESIKKRLVKERRMNEATKILQKLSKLHAKPMLHNTVQIVQLLNRISIDSSSQLAAGSSSGTMIDGGDLMRGLSASMEQHSQSQRQFSHSTGGSQSTVPFNDITGHVQSSWDSMLDTLPIQQRQYAPSSSSSFTSQSFYPQQQQQQQQQQSQHQESPKHEHTVHPQTSINEQVILRDLVFNIQGVDGEYIRFDPLVDGFVLDPKFSVPVSTRTMVSKLTELGWLFRRIKAFVEYPNQNSLGLVYQSFCAVVNSELTSYYKQVALLEQQVYSSSTQALEQQVTLKKLYVWHMEPLDRLKALAVLVDACRDKRGGALTSIVYSYTKHGEPFVRSFISDILRQVCQPIYDMIRRWVFEGVLEDPFSDFFITSDASVSITSLWHKKFSVVESMIPSFMSKELADDILLVGKSINFIRHCCNDTEWTMDSTTIAIAVDTFQYHPGASSFSSGDQKRDRSKLEKIIKRARTATNRRVMELLFDKYQFRMHCTALKQYLLLGQGEFIQYLLELLLDELNKPSHSIYRYNLIGIVESAIRGSNAQYDNTDVLNRLDVSLLSNPSSSVNSGWDIFSLDYRVTSPIDTIFTKPIMSTYLSIFRHLWRIKRVELLLNSTWTNHKVLAKMINTNKDITSPTCSTLIQSLQTTLHSCHVMRHEMAHFVNNMQYYLMFEVMESSWDELEKDLAKLRVDGNLDQLISAHHKFLSKVIERALLNKANANLRIQIEKLLSCVMQFIAVQDMMYNAANELLHKLAQIRMLSSSDEDMDNDIDMQDDRLEYAQLLDSPEHKTFQSSVPKLQIIQRTYTSLFTALNQMLSETDLHQVGTYKPLLTLQPFNDYYRVTSS